jgi:hypothetical protein
LNLAMIGRATIRVAAEAQLPCAQAWGARMCSGSTSERSIMKMFHGRRFPTAAALSIVILVSVRLAASAPAAVIQSFDELFQGDDPSKVYTFNLLFEPLTPSELRFDGFVENLDLFDETGVRFGLAWQAADGTHGIGATFPAGDDFNMGVRLPPVDPVLGTVRVPVQFSADLGLSSPAVVELIAEGLGPADNFRLVGDLTIQPVPEPDVLALFGAATCVGLLYRHFRRRS